MKRSGVALVACLVVLAGCGRFERSTTAPPSTLDDRPSADRDATSDRAAQEQATPPDRPPAPTGVTAPTAATHAPPSPSARPPATLVTGNVASATTDGLEVRVVAEEGPAYGSRPRFRIQVTLTNRGDRTRYHAMGQGNFAALVDAAGTPVWTSMSCNRTVEAYEIAGGAAAIEPGQEVSVVVDYPGPGSSDECHLPEGSYTLHGLFPICPDEQVRETANPGTYRCPEESIEPYASAGLPITIG